MVMPADNDVGGRENCLSGSYGNSTLYSSKYSIVNDARCVNVILIGI